MTITKEQFINYMLDCKGYDMDYITELLQTMKEEGTPIQEILSTSEMEECLAYN